MVEDVTSADSLHFFGSRLAPETGTGLVQGVPFLLAFYNPAGPVIVSVTGPCWVSGVSRKTRTPRQRDAYLRSFARRASLYLAPPGTCQPAPA